MNIRATLKRPSYLVLTIILTLVFIVLYGFFDLREGGMHTTLFTTHIQPPQFYILHFGAWYFWSLVVLDVLTSLFSAILISLTVANYRNRSSMFTGTACSTVATLGLGIATFGCPGCVMPIAGTLGAIFLTKTLPFFGLEFKALSLVIVFVTLAWLLHRLNPTPQLATQARA